MNIGLDVGYSAVKAVTQGRQTTFSSVVGTLNESSFSLNGSASIAMVEPSRYLVGEGATTQSRLVMRNESRAWAGSEEWYQLALAALTELTTATSGEMTIVTGLPVRFFSDRQRVAQRLVGEHRFRRDGRRGQTLTTTTIKVIPQPFGSLLSLALNDRGQLVDNSFADSVGVIDLGGKTCNILSVENLADVGRESTSVNVGAWDVTRAVGDWLAREHPDLELRDHKLMDAVVNRQTKYYGEPIDLTQIVDDTLAPMVNQVIGEAGKLWNGAAHLSAILITGGGALLFGSMLASHWQHARIVSDPVFANAVGYWKLAQRSG